MLYIDCFDKYGFEKSITARGEVRGDVIDINMSSIWTRLIKEAGRLCDSYASDLLIDIDSVQRTLTKCEDADFLFGFRRMGVDHMAFIICKDVKDLIEYRSVWKLEIRFKDNGYSGTDIFATLNEVNYNTCTHRNMELFGNKN